MLFERFEDAGLAHYSYVLACPASGQMAVVDPRRDVDVYTAFAEERGLSITHVLETHIHADFASGARGLAQQTEAELLVSGHDRGELFEVAFPHKDLFDGDLVEIGSIRIRALHTPGHTPEHLSFLAFDTTRSEESPMLFLTGDFLFVGSLGRPDLLGEEAKIQLALQLYESVTRRLPELPDGLKIHPAHGAGSFCGSGMSGLPTSTIGFERIANPYLNTDLSRDQFVEKILSTVPPFPEYYKRMKRINSEGPKILGELPGLHSKDAEAFWRLSQEEGSLVIDLRDQLAFGGGHVPGAFGIGAGQSLSMWASWVVPYDHPLLLVTENPEQTENAVRSLIRVGLDEVRGFLEGGMTDWLKAGFSVQSLPQISPRELDRKLRQQEPIQVLDVRTDEEWKSGHIEGAMHIMGGYLPDRIHEVPKERPVAVICGSGYRSTVAASVLQRAGFDSIQNVTGGMEAWVSAGLPIVQSSQEKKEAPGVEA